MVSRILNTFEMTPTGTGVAFPMISLVWQAARFSHGAGASISSCCSCKIHFLHGGLSPRSLQMMLPLVILEWYCVSHTKTTLQEHFSLA